MRNKTILSAIATAATSVAVLLAAASCQQVKDAAASAGQSIGGIGSKLSGGRVQPTQVDAAVDAAQTLTLGQTEEEGFGQTLAIKLSRQPGYVKDAALTAYVQKVGLVVSSVCDADDIDFVFGVLNDDRINAISGPRGYVFVTRGLVKACHDESELAGALAHEIAHVVKGHGLSAVKQGDLTKAGIKAASAGRSIDALGDVASKAADKLITGVYSQSQEDDADRLAVEYCKLANYAPDGLARLLERAYANRSATPFSSHPSTVDRVVRIRAVAGTGGGQTLADRFALNVK